MGFFRHLKATVKTLVISPLKHPITTVFGVAEDVVKVNKAISEEEKLNSIKCNKKGAMDAKFEEAKH